jgi:hypothetical protein
MENTNPKASIKVRIKAKTKASRRITSITQLRKRVSRKKHCCKKRKHHMLLFKFEKVK